MFKTIAFVLLAAILVVLGLALTKADDFRVERRIIIQAPADKVFAQLQDFHAWAAWSPWEKMDPAMKRSFSGAEAGLGAVYAWEGNDKVGAGRMEITEATPPGKLLVKLDFMRPFEGHNVTEFTLTSQGTGTELSWLMRGPTPFISKVMQVFVSMDAMIGKDFEAGLAQLKAVAER